MNCRFCGHDPELIMLVPARRKFDGAIEVFSCRNCAIEKGLYCVKHDKPHIGFDGDDTTACLSCIVEEVQVRKEMAEFLYRRLFRILPDPEWMELQEAAVIASTIMGENDAVAILRFMVTKAQREKVSVENIFDRVVQAGTASMLIPQTIFG